MVTKREIMIAYLLEMQRYGLNTDLTADEITKLPTLALEVLYERTSHDATHKDPLRKDAS